MAMNKREKQALADAQQAAKVHRALRWSFPASSVLRWETERDLDPPTWQSNVKHVLGWDLNLHRILSGYGPSPTLTGAVFKAWSSSRTLYSTRLRALRALRCELEQWAAERLAAIDDAIEAELGGCDDQA